MPAPGDPSYDCRRRSCATLFPDGATNAAAVAAFARRFRPACVNASRLSLRGYRAAAAAGRRPPVARGWPARSRAGLDRLEIRLRRGARGRRSAWSKPCSRSSQPPGSRCAGAPATISRRAARPSPPGVERRPRLVAQGRQRRVAFADVGRVGDDDGEPPPVQPLPPGRLDEVDARARAGGRCAGRPRGRRRWHRSAVTVAARMRVLDRQGDRAAAGAEVEPPRRRRERRPAARRPSRPGARFPGAAPAPRASPRASGRGTPFRRAGRRAARRAARRASQSAQRAAASPPSRSSSPAISWVGRAAEQPAEHQPGVEHRDAARPGLGERLGDRGVGAHAHASPLSSAASCSAACAACSAATTSPRSPSRIACSL